MNPTFAAVRDWAAPRLPVLQAAVLFTLGSALITSGMPLGFMFGGTEVLAPNHPLRLVSLAVICLAELLRSRAPAIGLLIGVGVLAVETTYGVSLAVIIVLADLLYSATLHGSKRTYWTIIWTVGTVVLVLSASAVIGAHDWREGIQGVITVLSIPVIPVWWATNVRMHRESAAAERARADHVSRIAELDQEAAIAAERARMARDLHDVIAGHLSAIAIQSEAALSMVDGDPAVMRRVLRSVRENSVDSLTEMRAMIGLLRDSGEDLDERTAPARLRDIGRLLESARAAGLHVEATTDVDADLPVAVDLSAYRIVQEALTNAVKHAPNSKAEVTVGSRDGTLVVEVRNERTGPDAQGSGLGLLNMRERAQAVGGVLVAGPHEREWRVRAELPAEKERGDR
jgi:signal transduction histidine kinase